MSSKSTTKDVFGFETASFSLAVPIEVVIIRRKLEALAQPWKEAHDRITQLRAKYEQSQDCDINAEEALKDHEEVVRLSAQREAAYGEWKIAFDAAKAANYKIAEDIREYCRRS